MVDVIKTSPVPVATIVSGKAMSCGAILLSCGSDGHRYAGPHSRILIHPVRGGAHGNSDDLKADVAATKRISKLAYKMMAKNCNQKKNFFLDKMKKKRNADWFLSPKECQKFGLINHIGTPTFHISLSSSVDFYVG